MQPDTRAIGDDTFIVFLFINPMRPRNNTRLITIFLLLNTMIGKKL